jgi:hypothetical protein
MRLRPRRENRRVKVSVTRLEACFARFRRSLTNSVAHQFYVQLALAGTIKLAEKHTLPPPEQ